MDQDHCCNVLEMREAHKVIYYQGARMRTVEALWKEAGKTWSKNQAQICHTVNCKNPYHWKDIPESDLTRSAIRNLFQTSLGERILSEATPEQTFHQILRNGIKTETDAYKIVELFGTTPAATRRYTDTHNLTMVQKVALDILEEEDASISEILETGRRAYMQPNTCVNYTWAQPEYYLGRLLGKQLLEMPDEILHEVACAIGNAAVDGRLDEVRTEVELICGRA